jgi:uncharacterized small protein (DUF1192 family)
MMFDEEGRKIDFGQHIGMDLTGMSVDELENYIINLKSEIIRVEETKQALESHNATADALFK